METLVMDPPIDQATSFGAGVSGYVEPGTGGGRFGSFQSTNGASRNESATGIHSNKSGSSFPVASRRVLPLGVMQMLAHEIRLRKEEGLRYDDARIMDVEKMEIIAVQVEDNRSPIVVCQFMAQQINCIRNAEGEVVEGSPGDIRAYFYVMAFQREYDDANHELVWKVVDFQLGGGEPYY